MVNIVVESIKRLEEKLNRIEANLINQKTVLTLEEAALYAGISKSTLYKLTSKAKISHFKPNNKMIYFDRSEFEKYLLSNRVKDTETIEREASSYCINKKEDLEI